ncbi:hypothetical protein O181_008531 [Austropuccinia psidii MF-1]|uniref:histone acetyltransferase n=1 Tax=Austropuccinia psidii MF-1 TaxID=1389203 RepID=A0A9Q3BQ15_9BASI|nr:hypothetical protein [Austropuccinia psidii MF-1]
MAEFNKTDSPSPTIGSVLDEKNGIDEEEAILYDRQIRLWGVEAQNRMRRSSVLMINFKGITTEACKNIVLAGVGSITILDDEVVSYEDLGAGFFFREEDIGKKRVEVAKERVNSLNPRVKVLSIAEKVETQIFENGFMTNFDVVCLTDSNSVMIEKVNGLCRKAGTPFFAAGSLGISGYIFSDLLDHTYLRERETTLINGETKKTHEKQTQTFLPFDAALKSPLHHVTPRRLKKLSPLLWACLALFEYHNKHGGAQPEGEHCASQLIEICQQILRSRHIDESLTPIEALTNLTRMCMHELVATCAIIGSVLSQEVLNVLGGKQPPLDAFMYNNYSLEPASEAPGPGYSSSSPSESHPISSKDHSNTRKTKRIGKENSSHGPTLEVGLVNINQVIFGSYQITPWFPSPYIIDQSKPNPSISNSIPQSNPKKSSVSIPNKDNHHSHQSNLLSSNQSLHDRLQKKKKKQKTSKNHQEINYIQRGSELSNQVPHQRDLNSFNRPLNHAISHQLASHQQASLSSSPSSSFPTSPQSAHQQSHLIPSTPLYPNSQSFQPILSSENQITRNLPTKKPTKLSSSNSPPFIQLFVCSNCLRYMSSVDAYLQHQKICPIKHPPGRKVYQRGALIIREVDGSEEKIYCQCLCLFGKLFIDHKYIFFDVQGFSFYVLTEESSPGQEEILGFFSKEKISYDDYNLACIVTFPPYQKRGFGTLLIEFSYELDRFEARRDGRLIPGTPERPLSELGAKGYLNFWTSVLVRYFQTLLNHRQASHTRPTEPQDEPIRIELTLEYIARSTALRPDDAAFALITSGLTQLKDTNENSDSKDMIIITPELIEHVSKKIHIKLPALDPKSVLLQLEH